MASCSSTNEHYNPAKSHHTPTGFRNTDPSKGPAGQGPFFKWQWERITSGLPKPPQAATPQVAPDLAKIAGYTARAQPQITWIGHSTMLMQMGGLSFITDPHFSKRASPVPFAGPARLYPPALTATELPRLDVVLISHNHYDHLDTASVRALNAQAGGPPLFIVPLGIKKWLAAEGIQNAVELDWWDTHTVNTPAGSAEFILTPAQHWSARTPFDRSDTLWGGFAVLASDFHFFYSGDTGYSADFKAIQQRLAPRQAAGGFDIALLPVGCYEPRWFMSTQHANPEDATQIHIDLKAKRSVGVHWGTFQGLCDEALDQAPKDLAAARAKQGLSEEQFFVMKLGETRELPRR